MHTILFDSYRKHQKEIKDNIVKAIFKLPIVAKVLFIGLDCQFDDKLFYALMMPMNLRIL